MAQDRTRRQFITQVGAAAAVAVPAAQLLADVKKEKPKRSRVVIARDEALTQGRVAEHRERLIQMLDAAMQRLTDTTTPEAAWKSLFKPTNRVGIKVNGLGRTTQPTTVDALINGLRQAGIPDEQIIVWDRSDRELRGAHFKLNDTKSGVKCYGTDNAAGGYQSEIETSGNIGSHYAKILSEQVDKVISVPVLKDHGIAGVSLGIKNFYGAIHNPNKYHGNNCAPFAADIVAHRFIGPRWKLTLIDGMRGQYNGGPGKHPGFSWKFGGFVLGTDFVSVDAVGADLIDKHRVEKGMKTVAQSGRPTTHIMNAQEQGLGIADLGRIDRIVI